jgi:hypothetical protein
MEKLRERLEPDVKGKAHNITEKMESRSLLTSHFDHEDIRNK